jgi:hypothetical protein
VVNIGEPQPWDLRRGTGIVGRGSDGGPVGGQEGVRRGIRRGSGGGQEGVRKPALPTLHLL